MIPCSHCSHPTDEHDVFCGACGAYLERGAEPEVFRKAARSVIRPAKHVLVWGNSCLLAFIVFIAFPVILIAATMAGKNIGVLLGLIVILVPCVMMIRRASLRRAACPACRQKLWIHSYLRNGRFCPECGTRIQAGEGSIRSDELPSLPALEVCRCCGTPERETHQSFCHACGANMSKDPQDRFCAIGSDSMGGECVRAVVCTCCNGVYASDSLVSIREYCPWCGVKSINVLTRNTPQR